MGAHFERGRILAALRRYAEAIEAYRQELALDPNCVATHANIAAAQFNLGRVADAEDTIRHSLGIDPSFAHSYYILSMIERRNGRPDSALAASLDAVRLAQQAIFFCELARVHHDSQRPAEALAATASALELQPDHVGSLVLRAEIFSRLGRTEEAAEVLKSQIANHAENAEFIASLGKIAFDLHDTAEAIDLLHEGGRLDPVAHLNLDRLAEAYGRRWHPFRAFDALARRLQTWKPVNRTALILAIATAMIVDHLLVDVASPAAVAAQVIIYIIAANVVLLTYAPWMTSTYHRLAGKLVARRKLHLSWRDVLREYWRSPLIAMAVFQLLASYLGAGAAVSSGAAFGCAAMIAYLEIFRWLVRAFPRRGHVLFWLLLYFMLIPAVLGARSLSQRSPAVLGWWALLLAIIAACAWIWTRRQRTATQAN